MLKFKVNTKRFEAQLKEVIDKKIKARLDVIGQNFLLETYGLIATNSRQGGLSPVLTGNYYNNHVVSINQHSNEVRSFGSQLSTKNPLPFRPLDQAVLKDFNISMGDTAYIANNVPYAELIEAGSSSKAPKGVYKVAAKMAIFAYKQRTTQFTASFQ